MNPCSKCISLPQPVAFSSDKLQVLEPIWYVCLKSKNCYLKIFVKICVEKNILKYIKYYLKTENNGLKIQIQPILEVIIFRVKSKSKNNSNITVKKASR